MRIQRQLCLARLGRAERGLGFTLVELTVVVSVILFALVAMSQSLVASMKLTGTNRESALATDGVRDVIEEIQGVEDFQTIFARYNANTADDPAGGPSPGPGFAVAGLEAVAGDPDGFVGEVVFPTIGTELREDLVDPALGMPRDLTGDGIVDGVNHAGDYRLLPVLLRLRWKGRGCERSMEIRTLVADR
jgi:type II secretory pathway pseudopilin PulG